MQNCPPFQLFLRPLLELSAGGEVRVRATADIIADQLGLSDEAKAELNRSGNQKKYIERIHWAATYLRQAKLVETTRRGHVQITPEGSAFLNSHQGEITPADLSKIPAFQEFEGRIGTRKNRQSSEQAGSASYTDSQTPHDRINEAMDEIEAALADELLSQLLDCEPEFFEQVIVNLLMAMGYGGDNEEAGQRLGKTSDGGIDGIVTQNPLGLERVFIQAKRYKPGNTIQIEAIRGFAGALIDRVQEGKGIFVTTSSFSKGAKEFVERGRHRIVLIDGQRLTHLMIAHDIGCTPQRTRLIKHFDRDYFDVD